METITFDETKIKPCPFCAEPIQAAAVKCRFCNEFLNTEKAKRIIAEQSGEPLEDEDEEILFAANPSLFGLAGAAIKASLFMALALFIIIYPAEQLSIFKLSDAQAVTFAQYRAIIGTGLAILVVLILLYKTVKLQMTYYEITADRIEFSRGILDRKVDNLDMFRVVDLSLRRSILDCIVGIGSVTLLTTDKTDPEFTFEKIRHPRKLYDTIKRASLNADQKNSVIHLE